MSDVQNAPAPGGGEAVPDTPAHVAGGTGAISVRDAARSLSDWRNKLNSTTSAPAIEKSTSQPPRAAPVSQSSAPTEVPAADQSAPEADANPDEGHGETSEAEAPEEPIDPPVSWTTAEKERWQAIPRETQEYIAKRETERERLLTKSRNEAAEQLKGLTAREQAMEQARLQFEEATRVALQQSLQQLQGEFGDIKGDDDIKKLADQDWARYLRWDAHQKVLASQMQVANQANERRAQDQRAAFEKFAQEQDKKFIEQAPDFADKEKAAELQRDAIKTLKNVGFSEEDLTKHWNGQEWLSLRDAKTQTLIQKAALWDRAQEAKKAVVSNKTLPAVQRPGVAQPGNSKEAQIQAKQREFNSATGRRQLQLGAELTAMQRAAGMLNR